MTERGAILLEDVRKEYQIVQKAAPRVGGVILSKALEYFRRSPFEALSGVTLRINRGEMVGFLGHNGAGKSTLLKLIAGITEPTSGRVEVHGRVTSLLELGVGFHPDLTGMENIFYNGAIMGMSKRQILQRLESIIAFSGIADFLYEPVRHYSSGMYSRLACSVALHLEPEIILVDEILSVGDSEFQQRALLKVRELHAAGVTVLLVSHDAPTMASLCPRIVWLDHGRVREDGASAHVMAHYSKHMIEQAERDGPFAKDFVRPAVPLLESLSSDPPPPYAPGQSFALTIALRPVDRPVKVVLRWLKPSGEVLFEDESPALKPGTTSLRYVVESLPLCPVDGVMGLALLDAETGAVLDQFSDALGFAITSELLYHNFATRCANPWTITPVTTHA